VILFFGPAGAGKSVQGQILAARQGWKWLSTGEMFRNSKNADIQEILKTGELINDEKTYEVVREAMSESKDVSKMIVDGFPRTMAQAEWLMESTNELGRKVAIVIVLEVPESVIQERLGLRGRDQDKPEIIARRMNIYRKEMYPVLGYFAEKDIKVVHIDGTGTVGQIHDKIMAELEHSQLT
jgi:adenylate kinase